MLVLQMPLTRCRILLLFWLFNCLKQNVIYVCWQGGRCQLWAEYQKIKYRNSKGFKILYTPELFIL